MTKEKLKESYREWSEELFFERPDRPIYHGDGTMSFITNCDHVVKGIAVLLYPASKVPCVFCANCGGWIATLKQWQEWDQEHRDIYKDPFRPKIKLSFSTSDRCLRSFWDLDPNEFQFVEITFLDPPIKKAGGLFRNLGKKITKAMRESEMYPLTLEENEALFSEGLACDVHLRTNLSESMWWSNVKVKVVHQSDDLNQCSVMIYSVTKCFFAPIIISGRLYNVFKKPKWHRRALLTVPMVLMRGEDSFDIK